MNAWITAATMIKFGRFPDRSAAELGREAIVALMRDANLEPKDIDAVYVGRSFAGSMDGQICVPGQVALRGTGINDIPVLNFENACASAVSALHCAVNAVAAGQHDTILVLGMDKLYAPSRDDSMTALFGALDVGAENWMLEKRRQTGSWGSIFMDNYYAKIARAYMQDSGAKPMDLARVSVKNRRHAAANEFAQYQKPITEEEVLASPIVAEPLHQLMCSPLTDGAAAFLVCSKGSRHANGPRVKIASVAIRSGMPERGDAEHVISRTARHAFDKAGIGPGDVDIAELHDASAVAELVGSELIGLCKPGEGPALLQEGATEVGGRLPINVSGGLLSRGHPGAATGAAQIVELVWQLQGRAGKRQVEGARVGLAHSAGGRVGDETACTAITILQADA